MAETDKPASPDSGLNLSTVFDGETIKIGGRPYTVRHPDALTLGAYKWIQRNFPRMGALMVRAELTDAEETELEALLERTVHYVLEAPEEVKAALRPVQRLQVADAFVELRLRMKAAATGAAPRQSGARSSRGSKGSTAGRRPRGFKTYR